MEILTLEIVISQWANLVQPQYILCLWQIILNFHIRKLDHNKTTFWRRRVNKSKNTAVRRAKIVTLNQSPNTSSDQMVNCQMGQLHCQVPQLLDYHLSKVLEEQFQWDHLVHPKKLINNLYKFNKTCKPTTKRLTQLCACLVWPLQI